jgi:hypothetical protein
MTSPGPNDRTRRPRKKSRGAHARSMTDDHGETNLAVLSRLLARRMLDVAGIRLCKVTDDVATKSRAVLDKLGRGNRGRLRSRLS